MRALVALFAALLLCGRAHAQTMRPTSLESARQWGLEQGLMAGIALSHAVQPVAVLTGDLQWKPKHWVAISGGVLYTATFVGLMYYQRPALYAAVIGPMAGGTAVFGGWLLNRAGVIDMEIRPDVFQIAGGVLQVPAAILAWRMLREEEAGARARRERSWGLSVRMDF